MNTEFHTTFEWFMQMRVQNLDGMDQWHIPYKYPNFFVHTEPNHMEFRRDVDN